MSTNLPTIQQSKTKCQAEKNAEFKSDNPMEMRPKQQHVIHSFFLFYGSNAA